MILGIAIETDKGIYQINFKQHKEDIAYPDGENGADVWKRCKQGIDDIISHKYERTAIVCHGGTIRSVICGLPDIPQLTSGKLFDQHYKTA